MMTATANVSHPLGANFLLGQNKGLIRLGNTNPPQILELCDAERRFGPKIEPLACYEKDIERKQYILHSSIHNWKC